MEVWIKRDDETGLVTSGNKIRKLQFLLADAIDKEHDCVVTIGTFTKVPAVLVCVSYRLFRVWVVPMPAGGWQSNHCRATAAAARELGIECHLILRTDYTPENIPITGRRYLICRSLSLTV